MNFLSVTIQFVAYDGSFQQWYLKNRVYWVLNFARI